GEVTQGIVAEAGLESQLSGASVTHQLFDGKKASLAQPLSGEQSPQQSAGWFARLQTAIAAILEKVPQPQTLHRVMLRGCSPSVRLNVSEQKLFDLIMALDLDAEVYHSARRPGAT